MTSKVTTFTSLTETFRTSAAAVLRPGLEFAFFCLLQSTHPPSQLYTSTLTTPTMSSSSLHDPISPSRFSAALQSLPLDALHAKAAELRNSITHLKASNTQMLPFAEEGDQDCKEAMFENLAVIGRMNERVRLLREEVEGRGMMWAEGDDGDGKVVNGNGTINGTQRPSGSGSLTDEELRRQLEAQMGDDGDEEDGVHL